MLHQLSWINQGTFFLEVSQPSSGGSTPSLKLLPSKNMSTEGVNSDSLPYSILLGTFSLESVGEG